MKSDTTSFSAIFIWLYYIISLANFWIKKQSGSGLISAAMGHGFSPEFVTILTKKYFVTKVFCIPPTPCHYSYTKWSQRLSFKQ